MALVISVGCIAEPQNTPATTTEDFNPQDPKASETPRAICQLLVAGDLRDLGLHQSVSAKAAGSLCVGSEWFRARGVMA